jgi:hypothetical protein
MRAALLLLGTGLGGCRPAPAGPPVVAVDLIKEFDRADVRPPSSVRVESRDRPLLAAPASSRIVWTLPLPRGGRFHAYASIEGTGPVRFRVGVSDARVYEQLTDVVAAAGSGWTEMTADLSAYAGFKWSLFYRPDRVSWRVNLSTDALGGPATALWGAPEIDTDRSSVKEYRERRYGTP